MVRTAVHRATCRWGSGSGCSVGCVTRTNDRPHRNDGGQYMPDWRCPPPVARLESEETIEDVPGVPEGVRVGRLRECAAGGHDACRAACERLADHLSGLAADGQHRSIASYGEVES